MVNNCRNNGRRARISRCVAVATQTASEAVDYTDDKTDINWTSVADCRRANMSLHYLVKYHFVKNRINGKQVDCRPSANRVR